MTRYLTIPAKWYTNTNGRAIKTLVFHRQEAPVRVGTAEATARYFQNLPASNKASAHKVYDPETVVTCVQNKDVAYACPGLNNCGIQYELPGYSADNDWTTDGMVESCRLAAVDMVNDAIASQIPLVWRDAAALADGQWYGWTTHWEATKAKIGGNNHTDPGKYFDPMWFQNLLLSQPNADMTPDWVPPFPGDDMSVSPNAGMGFVSSAEANLPGEGGYTLTADGGIRAQEHTFIPSAGAWNYLGLPASERQGSRQFTAITPNEDGSPGYTQWGSDGTRYAFGPGKNGWPL
jgi:hypothetical protein